MKEVTDDMFALAYNYREYGQISMMLGFTLWSPYAPSLTVVKLSTVGTQGSDTGFV